MKEAIAVVCQKGGVAKTTTALALAYGLQRRGYSVLMVDTDSQANLTFASGSGAVEQTTYNAMLRGSADGLIQSLPYGVDLLGGGDNLARADSALADAKGREYMLKEALAPIEDRYDYIVIDTPPTLGLLTVNALTACTGALITSQADIFSLQGITSLEQTIEVVRQFSNPSLEVKGIVITRYNARTSIGQSMSQSLEQIAQAMNTKVYHTKIRECTALKEAQLLKESIYTYAPRSNASKDYKALVDEILEEGQKR